MAELLEWWHKQTMKSNQLLVIGNVVVGIIESKTWYFPHSIVFNQRWRSVMHSRFHWQGKISC